MILSTDVNIRPEAEPQVHFDINFQLLFMEIRENHLRFRPQESNFISFWKHNNQYNVPYYRLFVTSTSVLGMTIFPILWWLHHSDNDFLPVRHQAIIWISDGSLLIGPFNINCEFELKYNNFNARNWAKYLVCKMSSILSRPKCDQMVPPFPPTQQGELVNSCHTVEESF